VLCDGHPPSGTVPPLELLLVPLLEPLEELLVVTPLELALTVPLLELTVPLELPLLAPPSSSSGGVTVPLLPELHAAAAANPASATIESNPARELKTRFMLRFSKCIKVEYPGPLPGCPQDANARRLVP
jgi:hypothetical protein